MNRLILQSMTFALLMASATLNVFAADKPKAEAERARRAEILQRKFQEEKKALESQLEAARRETETEAAAAQQAKSSLGRVQLELGKLRGSLSSSNAAQAALRADLAAGTAALAELQAQLASEREQWRLNAARAEQEFQPFRAMLFGADFGTPQQVALADDTDQSPGLIDDGQAADAMVEHGGDRLPHAGTGRDGDRG